MVIVAGAGAEVGVTEQSHVQQRMPAANLDDAEDQASTTPATRQPMTRGSVQPRSGA
jgi:hypothetical protein